MPPGRGFPCPQSKRHVPFSFSRAAAFFFFAAQNFFLFAADAAAAAAASEGQMHNLKFWDGQRSRTATRDTRKWRLNKDNSFFGRE